jgi:cellulose synthase/poly-beta-1,6-N-acetylglucosamine synthase-like glycosyltransferase/peptidoglycan/xylan/chitin deacetylase (PgdA/CDA1 family)
MRRAGSWWWPRPAWCAAVFVLVLFCAALALNGVVTGAVGNDAYAASPGPGDRVPARVSGGGPVIDASHPKVRSYRMPPKTIALSFDDGPNPRWTPQILAVLRHYHVPGTFFEIGSLISRYPKITREVVASGSQVGLHTFTHPDLATRSNARVRVELAETDLALAGATGKNTYLLRPPYSSEADAVDNAHLAEMRNTASQGYLTVLTSTDSEDWRRPGVARIVANATPQAGQGSIVLMHDAGGDRSQTVAALKRFIPKMRARGYRFTTVTDALGLPAGDTPAPFTQRLFGHVMITAVTVSRVIVHTLTWALVLLGALTVARLGLMLLVARHHRRRRADPAFGWGEPPGLAVSVIVPAHNEAANIAATVRSLTASERPVEVVVVDDGSTDHTAEIVQRLALPGVRVIRQANAGKPAALNTGIAAARGEIIVMIDGDTVFEPGTVTELLAPFADPQVGGVAGRACVAGQRSLLTAWQHIEYVVGFGIDRRVYDQWRCMPTIPGVAGAFRRATLLAVGGVSSDTLAEDTDLTMAICRAGWRVVYQPEARSHTETPRTLPDLWRQRYRWCYGTLQSMWKHRAAVLAKGPAGRFGRAGLAHLALFQVLLPLLSPLIDVFLLYGLIFLNPTVTLAAWGGMITLQLLTAIYAFHLESERMRVLWLLPLQQILYRQLTYLVVLASVLSALRGIQLRWHSPRRTGGLDTLLHNDSPTVPITPTQAPEQSELSSATSR